METSLKMHFPLCFCCLCLHCGRCSPLIARCCYIRRCLGTPFTQEVLLVTQLHCNSPSSPSPALPEASRLPCALSGREPGCLQSCELLFRPSSKRTGLLTMLSEVCRQGGWPGSYLGGVERSGSSLGFRLVSARCQHWTPDKVCFCASPQ